MQSVSKVTRLETRSAESQAANDTNGANGMLRAPAVPDVVFVFCRCAYALAWGE